MDEAVPRVELKFLLHEDGSIKSLTLPKNTSILDIKCMLSRDYGRSPREHEILFCGHTMKDEDILLDYDIGHQTTLHVITRPEQECQPYTARSHENYTFGKIQYLTGIWLHRQHMRHPLFSQRGTDYQVDPLLSSKYPQFYVYCKDQCMKVAPGKLRVRCANCKLEGIVLHGEPRGWCDVLRAEQILANCFSKECEGALCDAEFYFKCGLCQNNCGSAIPLRNVISNSEEILCTTCMDVDNPVVSFPCSVDHVMCLTCFEQYARNSLQERKMVLDKNTGYSVLCPEGCRGSHLLDTHIFHMLGTDEYMTYQAFAAEECLIHEMHGMICPNLTCGMGLYPDVASDFQNNIEITCSSCRHKFCSSCREVYHGSSECGSQLGPNTSSSAVVRDYLASVKTIQEISKKCPKCKVPTERNGGCMHMTCRVCRFEWCWNCLTEWSYNCQANHWFT